MRKLFRVLSFVKPYKKNLILVFMFNIFSSIFSVFSLSMVVPFLSVLFGKMDRPDHLVPFSFSYDVIKNNFAYYIGNMIDINGPLYALAFLCVGIVTLMFLKNTFSYLSQYNLSPISNGVVCDIRNALFRKILKLPLGYFSEERKGDIMAKVTSDVQEVEVSILRSLEMIFRDPILIAVYLTTLIVMSAQLTLFILLMLALIGAVIGRLGRSLRKSSTKVQFKLGEILSILEETLGGLRIIKAFNAEKIVGAKFVDNNNIYRNMLVRMWRRRDLASPMTEFLSMVVIIIVIYFGGRLVLGHDKLLSAEALIGYLVVFSQIITPAKSFSQSYYNVLRGYASIERIDEILSAENTIVDAPDAQDLKVFDSKIEYKNVNFRYGEEYVLKDINMTIEKGKTVALVGKSGSGKTTLAELLPRFYDIESGEILIDGIPLNKIKLQDIRGLMGIVSQESILFNDNFYNNISFGLDSTTPEKVEAAAKVANAHEFIIASENGYKSNIGDRGSKLSGGQRQRISIARAVLKNPPILILDEATSALDTESEFLVQEALFNLMKNRTSIVIAHRLSTIKYADEICVLHEGRIVERGKHDDLLALNGYYKKLYDLQMF